MLEKNELQSNNRIAHACGAFSAGLVLLAIAGNGLRPLPLRADISAKAVSVKIMPLSAGQASQDLSKSVPIEAPRFVPDTQDYPKLNEKKEVAKTPQDAPAKNTDRDVPDLLINPEVVLSPDNEVIVSPILSQLPPNTQQSTELGVPSVPDEFAIPIEVFDAPNQGVLMLALLVNDQGGVDDIRILVPSGRDDLDMLLALNAKLGRYTSLVPPIEKGTQRWVPHRIRLSDNKSFIP